MVGSTTAIPTAPPNGTLRVHYVNVGQGDGTIWELPGGSFIVYDCGPPVGSAAANPVVQALHGLGVASGGTLFALVASHGHNDHTGGCEEVLSEFRVLHAYETWYEGADAPQSYHRFQDELKAEGATMHVLHATTALEGEETFHAGDQLALPQDARAAGVSAEVLWPPDWQGSSWDDIAASSVAVRLSFGTTSFCFQGDVEEAQERELTQRLGERGCDVYLMGHHGSKYASSSGWVHAMHPLLAPVSFGNNTYGHPTSEALCRVQSEGTKVYATQRDGSIAVESDGRRLSVQPDEPETKDYCVPGIDYWAT
ncbi:MAG: hypothetical protein LC624_08320 [Halobacteriales archaeon]|nr:hypothetical protein [Halobacteriales archaeon]